MDVTHRFLKSHCDAQCSSSDCKSRTHVVSCNICMIMDWDKQYLTRLSNFFFFFLVGGRLLSWNGVFRSEPEPFFSQRSAVPQSWLRTKVDRVFSVTAFILSNNLPEEIRLASSFKSLLKPYFWKRALTGFEVWNLFQLLNHFLKHRKAVCFYSY